MEANNAQSRSQSADKLEKLILAPDTPFGAFPFQYLENEDFASLMSEAIRREECALQAIEQCKDEPTFANTIEPLEHSGEAVEAVAGAFYNLLATRSSEQMNQWAEQFAEQLTALRMRKLHSSIIYERVSAIYSSKQNGLNTEEQRLLKQTYDAFVDSGACLPESEKMTLENAFSMLSHATTAFGNNVLKDGELFRYFVPADSEIVSSLPEAARAQAKQRCAQERDEEGYLFTLSEPDYRAVITYAPDESMRKTFYFARMKRGYSDNCYNNEHLVRRIVKTRTFVAHLLYNNTYANFVLKDRMLSCSEQVLHLLKDLESASRAKCNAELAQLSRHFPEVPLELWNIPYLFECERKRYFDYDREELRAYFPVKKCLQGVFGLAERLYNIRFSQRNDIPVYHPLVLVYEVVDLQTSEFLGLLYVDLYARQGKRGGAWMNNLREQNGEKRPHILIAANFTPPDEAGNALLYFEDLHTLLHEFGHALHGLLTKTTFPSLSGTSVVRDFVELPSQLMENWLYEPEFIYSFAAHYRTNAPIPEDLWHKVMAARNFRSGYDTQRQLAFAFLDMAYHSLEFDLDMEPDAIRIEKEAMKQAQAFPALPDGCLMSASFGHLFSGGYAAGYYGYKWSEVLAADAFSLFKEKGIFSSEVAARFRKEILEKGDTEEAADLYRRFRGRKPRIDALLRRDGLIE